MNIRSISTYCLGNLTHTLKVRDDKETSTHCHRNQRHPFTISTNFPNRKYVFTSRGKKLSGVQCGYVSGTLNACFAII